MKTLFESSTVSVSSTLRTTPAPLRGAGVPFQKMKDAILGKEYELSIVYTGKKLSQKLNRSHRGKNRPTNVLSFPLSPLSGELFLDVRTIEQEKSQWDRTLTDHTALLIIHGMLHLKGYDHGPKMEEKEEQFASQFNLS